MTATVSPSTIVLPSLVSAGITPLGTIDYSGDLSGFIAKIGATTFSRSGSDGNSKWLEADTERWIEARVASQSETTLSVTPPSGVWVDSGQGAFIAPAGNFVDENTDIWIPPTGAWGLIDPKFYKDGEWTNATTGQVAIASIQGHINGVPYAISNTITGVDWNFPGELSVDWQVLTPPVGAWTDQGGNMWTPPVGTWIDSNGETWTPPVGDWYSTGSSWKITGTWFNVTTSTSYPDEDGYVYFLSSTEYATPNPFNISFYPKTAWTPVGGGFSGDTLANSLSGALPITIELRLNIPANASTQGDFLLNAEILLIG